MALGMPMAGDPRAGSAAQIAAKARPRRDHVYVEMRRCHHCQQQGHLRQVCPTAKQDKHGADDEEADNTRRLSADPLPIRHGDREVHWQGATREVPVHPHQEASQEDKHGEDDEEADNARRLIADPLPIRHGDREVHWQGEVPVHPHQEASQEDELLDFDIDVRSDSTCRDNDACLCHWCKRSKLRLRGIRPSLRQRADDVGLDTDEPGWVCDLRAMGEISDGEWAELYGDNESSNSDSVSSAGSSAPHPPAAAASSSGAVVDVSDAATAAVLAFFCRGGLAANAVLDDFGRRPQ